MSGVAVSLDSVPAPAPPVCLAEDRVRWDRRYLLAAALCLLGGLAFQIDLPVSQWLHTRQGLKWLHQPLQVAESLADATGVAIVMITLYLIAVSRRRELLRMLFSVLAGGLSADVVKFCVARLRPRSYPKEGLLDVQSVWDTFYGWLPFLKSGAVATSAQYQSFPSAHTATGVAFAVALTRMYPRGWWWFGLIAATVTLQRIETGAHYVSDTCFGAAIGLLAAVSFQRGTPWARWCDNFETGELGGVSPRMGSTTSSHD